jgi:hypothetical protein
MFFCLLSGGHLNITEAFGTLEDHLKKVQADPADSVTPPLQPWYDGLLPAAGRHHRFLHSPF